MAERHVAIDVETSGLSPYRSGRGVEVAAVEIRNGGGGAECPPSSMRLAAFILPWPGSTA